MQARGFLSNAKCPNRAHGRVNVDFPVRMIDSLGKEARRMDVIRESIGKVWSAERLEVVAVKTLLAKADG